VKNSKIKSALILALKFLFVAALLWFLAQKGFLSLSATLQAFQKPQILVPALIALVCASLISIYRWHLLLRAQGIHLKLLRTFQLGLIGIFFNSALPGAVSGDLIKAFYVAHEAAGQRGRAFGSILFDRIVGLSALILVSAGALIADWGSLVGTPLLGAVQFSILVSAAGFLAFYAYLFLIRDDRDPLLKLLLKLEPKQKQVGSILRIYQGVRHYRNHRASVLLAVGLSLIIHLIICWSSLRILGALGESVAEPLAAFVIVPLGLLVTAVPVMPGGVGTGHAAFGYLFHFLGALRGADVFSLYVLVQFALGAMGGLIYLRFKKAIPAKEQV
jgi:uncharacterized protein (TIRG00374 family)